MTFPPKINEMHDEDLAILRRRAPLQMTYVSNVIDINSDYQFPGEFDMSLAIQDVISHVMDCLPCMKYDNAEILALIGAYFQELVSEQMMNKHAYTAEANELYDAAEMFKDQALFAEKTATELHEKIVCCVNANHPDAGELRKAGARPQKFGAVSVPNLDVLLHDINSTPPVEIVASNNPPHSSRCINLSPFCRYLDPCPCEEARKPKIQSFTHVFRIVGMVNPAYGFTSPLRGYVCGDECMTSILNELRNEEGYTHCGDANVSQYELRGDNGEIRDVVEFVVSSIPTDTQSCNVCDKRIK